MPINFGGSGGDKREIIKSSTEPSDKKVIWQDTSVSPNVQRYHDGSNWIKFSAGSSSGDPTIDDRQIENIGVGVQNGLNVLDSATPDMNVHVQTGVIYNPNGQRFEFATTTTKAVPLADTLNPRKDIVFVDKNGVITYTAGTPGSTPTEPSLPSGAHKLCVVDVPAGDTAIDQTQITDTRTLKDDVAYNKDLTAHTGDTTNPHNVTPSQIGAEPSFTKNTGFNLDLGTTAGTIAEGNHTHADLHTHSNKGLLDILSQSGTETSFDLSTFEAKGHTHLEADITDLDKYTKTEVDNKLSAKQKNITQSTTAPTSPVDGDLWLDESVSPNVLKKWDGTLTTPAWVKVTPTTASEVGASADTHNHDGVYEPVITKNTAFNKNFGTAAGTVAEGSELATKITDPSTKASGDVLTYDGTNWVSQAPSGGGGSKIYARGEVSSTVSVGSGSNVHIPIDSAVEDASGIIDTTNGVIAINKDGTYRFDFNLVYGSGADGATVSYAVKAYDSAGTQKAARYFETTKNKPTTSYDWENNPHNFTLTGLVNGDTVKAMITFSNGQVRSGYLGTYMEVQEV